MDRQRVLIDTDPGQDIDDLLAILFALCREELSIEAITTVTFPADQRARLVKRLLRYLGRTDIPVAAGMQFPLRSMSAADISYQYDRRETMNHYAFAQPEDSCDQPDGGDAVDLIIRTVEKYPGEVILACIAPLTNIACALQKRPDIAAKIKAIAMMGGEVTLHRAEHNVAFDYVAADVVLSSGIPIAMGTWDVTRRFVLTRDECDVFRKDASALGQALGKAIDLWSPVHHWKPGPVMYDLFPIVWSYDRSFYTTKPMLIRVETRGELTRGMTVACPGEPNAEVTTEIRAAELRALYLDTVRARMSVLPRT